MSYKEFLLSQNMLKNQAVEYLAPNQPDETASSSETVQYSVNEFINRISSILNHENYQAFAVYTKYHAANQDANDLLQEVMHYLDSNPAKDQQHAIANKIYEGTMGCTRGYRDRLSEILVAAHFTFDIPHCIQAIRTSLVIRSAASESDEAHHRNRFLRVASEQLGLGVDFNDDTEDTFSANDEAIRALISSTFDNYFHPMIIFGQLYDELLSQLRSQGYQGAIEEEGRSYTAGDYEPWIETFKAFFSIKNQPDIEEILILNDSFITDLNLANIKRTLLNHLIDQFFNLPEPLAQTLLALFSEGSPDNITLNALNAIGHEKDWLELIRLCPEHNKKQLIEHYLNLGDNAFAKKQRQASLLSLLSQSIQPTHPALQEMAEQSVDELRNLIPRDELLLQLLRWVPAVSTEKKAALLNGLLEKQGNDKNRLQWLLQQRNRNNEAKWQALLDEKITASFMAYFPDKKILFNAIKNNQTSAELFIQVYTQTDVLSLTENDMERYFNTIYNCHPALMKPSLKLLEKYLFDQKEQGPVIQISSLVLIMAAYYYPEVVEPFLKIIETHRPELTFNILSQADDQGWNALMFATRFQPDTVKSLLQAMESLESEQKFKILSQVNKYGQNALMLAVIFQRKAVEPLLQATEYLESEQKFKILSQHDTAGCNILILAMLNDRNTLDRLVETILPLKPEQKFKMLSQMHYLNMNVLTYAFYFKTKEIPLLLKLMESLEPTQKFLILKDGWNHLLYIYFSKPEPLEHVLHAIELLEPEQKLQFLTQLNKGWNALMHAARDNPKTVEWILKIIEPLDPEQKFQILSQVNDEKANSALGYLRGSNALMFVARYQPETVKSLLQTVVLLEPEQKFKILNQVDINGQNALMLAAKWQPEAIKPLLKAMSSLPFSQQKTLLNQVDNKNDLIQEYSELLDALHSGHKTSLESFIHYPGLFRYLPENELNPQEIIELAQTHPELVNFLPEHVKSQTLINKIHAKEDISPKDWCQILCDWLEQYIIHEKQRLNMQNQSWVTTLASFFQPSSVQLKTKISAAEKLKLLLMSDNTETAQLTSAEHIALMDGSLYRLWSSNETLRDKIETLFSGVACSSGLWCNLVE